MIGARARPPGRIPFLPSLPGRTTDARSLAKKYRAQQYTVSRESCALRSDNVVFIVPMSSSVLLRQNTVDHAHR